MRTYIFKLLEIGPVNVVVMERHFSVEAKALCFTAKEGSYDLRLKERREGFVGVIIVGLQSSFWLVAVVEEAFRS